MEKKDIAVVTVAGLIKLIIAVLLVITGVVLIIKYPGSYPSLYFGLFMAIPCFIAAVILLIAFLLGLNLEISKRIKVYSVIGWLLIVLGIIIIVWQMNIWSFMNIPLIAGLILLWRANKMKAKLKNQSKGAI